MSSPLKQNITNLQNLLDKVNTLPEAGTDLPELTNPADASKALSGYEFINEDGEKVTGTIPTKTASDLTASGATVTVPSGYYASQATKSVATATQATPSVSIDSAGKITATTTQTAGYVSAGTKTGTKQLTTQAAKTITPSTSSQTAVAKNVYTTGAVTVAAIPSKYVDNSTVDAVESDVMSGKKFGASGGVKTGTFSLDSELSTQDNLISQIQTALQNKASASEPVLQTKTVTPTTSVQNVAPDSGYDGLSKVTVNAMPTATQATPSISVNSSGLITATATQTAGYVSAGTKSGTKQLTTKAATTYTPTTSNQTIAAGTYCSGAQTIKGDANLKAENIAEGVSIFGVTGTHSGGGSVETCTGRVAYDDMMNASEVPTYYTSSDLSVGNISAYSMSQEITTVKGSLLYMAAPSEAIVDRCTNATLIASTSNGKLFSIDADSFFVICMLG